MRRPRALAVALLASVVLGACAGPGESGASGASPSPATSGSSPAPATAPPTTPAGPENADDGAPHEILAFTADTVAGGTLDGATIRGDVALWFWAPW